RALAGDPGITLCYRRARVFHTFEWPYNLFCMIHGRARDEVAEYVEQLRTRYGLRRFAHDVLFSRRCFKQTGARYA
ncbi:MAG: Lrp/AsnC family transcriptional regulator, partial [Azoarcus sp.]|nr:Lrp/AsnC family transcriptional regulator [Azoarcus sp.]